MTRRFRQGRRHLLSLEQSFGTATTLVDPVGELGHVIDREKSDLTGTQPLDDVDGTVKSGGQDDDRTSSGRHRSEFGAIVGVKLRFAPEEEVDPRAVTRPLETAFVADHPVFLRQHGHGRAGRRIRDTDLPPRTRTVAAGAVADEGDAFAVRRPGADRRFIVFPGEFLRFLGLEVEQPELGRARGAGSRRCPA